MRFREQHVAESIRNSGLETSHQMEALNLQSVSKNVSQMCCMKRTHFIEEGQDETPSLVQEMASLIVEWCDAFLERINENDLAEGCEEAPEEPSMMASGSEAEADARQSELTQDSIKPARKPRANSKVNPKGVLVGHKRKKRCRAATHGGNQPLVGIPSTGAGDSPNLVSEERTSMSLGWSVQPLYKRCPSLVSHQLGKSLWKLCLRACDLFAIVQSIHKHHGACTARLLCSFFLTETGGKEAGWWILT